MEPAMPVAGAAGDDKPKTIPPAATDALQEDVSANQAIANILKQLKLKWESGTLPEPSQDEDVMETVMLSSTDESIELPADLPAKK